MTRQGDFVGGNSSMSEESIPLYDGELSGSAIIPDEEFVGDEANVAHSRRAVARRDCERVHVCFSAELDDDRVDHVECPVLNISKGGMAIEFDKPMRHGAKGSVSFRNVGNQPVRVNARVMRCAAQGKGRFILGLRFDRTLLVEECKPAYVRPGRDVSPGLRARKLSGADSPSALASTDATSR
jgi:hypothetical protein